MSLFNNKTIRILHVALHFRHNQHVLTIAFLLGRAYTEDSVRSVFVVVFVSFAIYEKLFWRNDGISEYLALYFKKQLQTFIATGFRGVVVDEDIFCGETFPMLLLSEDTIFTFIFKTNYYPQ